MNPDFEFEGLDPANRFAMDGLNMPYATELIYDGKPIPKELFLDIMIEKTQMLVTCLKTFTTWTCISSKYRRHCDNHKSV